MEAACASEAELPLTLTLRTRGVVTLSLLWKAPNGAFYAQDEC